MEAFSAGIASEIQSKDLEVPVRKKKCLLEEGIVSIVMLQSGPLCLAIEYES